MSRRCPDITKMKTLLSRDLVTLEEGVYKMMDYYNAYTIQKPQCLDYFPLFISYIRIINKKALIIENHSRALAICYFFKKEINRF